MSTSSDGAPGPAAANISPAIALAWGRRRDPTKGPTRAMTIDQIVATAIRKAAEEGLDAVSMSRLASDLGSSTMALYRYVPSKDDLLALMFDAALGPAPRAHAAEDTWRACLEHWLHAAHRSYLRHPWMLRVPIREPPLGPNNVDWLDDALRCLADVRLTEQAKVSTVVLLSGFVRVQSALTIEAASAPLDNGATSYGTMLRELIDPRRFVGVQRALDAGVFDSGSESDGEFVFGMNCILDGIQQLIEAGNT